MAITRKTYTIGEIEHSGDLERERRYFIQAGARVLRAEICRYEYESGEFEVEFSCSEEELLNRMSDLGSCIF